MDEQIKKLNEALEYLTEQDINFDRIALDHGSHDQTRAMMIQSIFEQAKGHLGMAIAQAKILKSQLY